MAQNQPKLTFLFPFRWLKEDKEFLAENIRRSIKKQANAPMLDEITQIPLYKIEIHYQYKEPIANFPLTKTQIERILKPLIPYGKCMGVFFNYQQHSSQTMLPLLDFRIYYQ